MNNNKEKVKKAFIIISSGIVVISTVVAAILIKKNNDLRNTCSTLQGENEALLKQNQKLLRDNYEANYFLGRERTKNLMKH